MASIGLRLGDGVTEGQPLRARAATEPVEKRVVEKLVESTTIEAV
jgi:hypothetical protein